MLLRNRLALTIACLLAATALAQAQPRAAAPCRTMVETSGEFFSRGRMDGRLDVCGVDRGQTRVEITSAGRALKTVFVSVADFARLERAIRLTNSELAGIGTREPRPCRHLGVVGIAAPNRRDFSVCEEAPSGAIALKIDDLLRDVYGWDER